MALDQLDFLLAAYPELKAPVTAGGRRNTLITSHNDELSPKLNDLQLRSMPAWECNVPEKNASIEYFLSKGLAARD